MYHPDHPEPPFIHSFMEPYAEGGLPLMAVSSPRECVDWSGCETHELFFLFTAPGSGEFARIALALSLLNVGISH